MDNRSRQIIGLIRSRLALSKNEQTITDDELYVVANGIQDEIFTRSRAFAREFTILTIAEQQEYSFLEEELLFVNMVMYDNYPLTVFPLKRMYSLPTEYGTPVYAGAGDRKLVVYPIPEISNKPIKVIGKQSKAIARMSDSVGPELPSYLDMTIVHGVVAHYKPENFGIYQEKLQDIIHRGNIKGDVASQVKSWW